MKYAPLQAGVDFFSWRLMAFESCPNCDRIVSESCKTMYGRINEQTERTEGTKGRLKGTEERTKRTEETKTTLACKQKGRVWQDSFATPSLTL